MLALRKATTADLDFLVWVDLEDEGVTHTSQHDSTEQETAEHRNKIAAFVADADDAAWVCVDAATGNSVGAIMCRFRDRSREECTEANDHLFRFLGDGWLPPDCRFCEVFQLWVEPACRRRGLASTMKRRVETEARRRGIALIYTHTEERNSHVIALNRKLGYREIRRGLLGDGAVRVSLVKELG